MRIACVYLPAFPLQVEVRLAPHLGGRAVIVADDGERPVVVAASRAAAALGVKVGMTVTQARALAPEQARTIHHVAVARRDVSRKIASAPGTDDDGGLEPGEEEARRKAARFPADRAAAGDAGESSGLTVVVGDAARTRAALGALAEALMAHSMTVDIGEPGELQTRQAIYLQVPPSARAHWAELVVTELSRQGYRGRVAVADDRFTAWAAALTHKQPTTIVPHGHAAEFLAPLPLGLLPIADEVRPMFDALGLRTIGEFAALPAPSVGRRWQASGVDVQELARGEGPTFLRGYLPREPVAEMMELEHEVTELEALGFVIRPLAERACQRLRGRGAALARATLRMSGEKQTTELVIGPARPTLSSRTVLDLARAMLAERGLDHPVTKIELVVTREGEPDTEELDLFEPRGHGEEVGVAVARLEAVFGEGAVRSSELTASHRPEAAFRLTPFLAPLNPPGRRPNGLHAGSPKGSPDHKSGQRKGAKKGKPGAPSRRGTKRHAVAKALVLPLAMSGMAGALRLIEPPSPQPAAPAAIELEGARVAVIAARGPTRLEAEWWSDDPVERDYYEVETADGGRYWVFRRKSDGQFYLHGVFD